MQYAGTGALKNDYTRHGKYGWRGKLNDGINAAQRSFLPLTPSYYLNNWTDGFRQDAFDLFLGNAPARPLPKKQKLQYIVFPSLAVAFAGLVFLTSKTK